MDIGSMSGLITQMFILLGSEFYRNILSFREYFPESGQGQFPHSQSTVPGLLPEITEFSTDLEGKTDRQIRIPCIRTQTFTQHSSVFQRRSELDEHNFSDKPVRPTADQKDFRQNFRNFVTNGKIVSWTLF